MLEVTTVFKIEQTLNAAIESKTSVKTEVEVATYLEVMLQVIVDAYN